MTNAPKFSSQGIELILKSLPAGADHRRRELLPKILREWASAYLPMHLSMPSTKAQKGRIKRLKAVDVCARKLMQALDAVDSNDDQFWIMREMIVADGQRLTPAERAKRENQLHEMQGFLRKLARASGESAKIWNRGRGQPRNDAASLVLMDIVVIYVWFTGNKATRQVDRDTHKDTGPFWTFAAAIWPLVFDDGVYGLSAAIKNWDSARKKKLKGTRSPLLANIAMDHPGWGIFEG
jgi:hypothetical protein